MTTAEQVLNSVVAWAAAEANVRRLVLVGSRARANPPDDLADIDLQVYVRSRESFTQDAAWLQKIGEPWLCIRDEYVDGNIAVPTRLVIFAGGVKADFAFYPADVVSHGVRAGLPHRLLLAKNGVDWNDLTTQSSLAEPELPSHAEFRRVADEFWFEAYHVAMYLARDELWLAQSRDSATKQFLLRMIDWHERVVRHHVQDPDVEGRRGAISQDTWAALHETFSGFAREESWRATLATTTLFQRLAADVAAALGFTYPADSDEKMSRLILALGDGVSRP